MKIEINFPEKSGDVEKMRQLFQDQVTKPIEDMIKKFCFDENFVFYDLETISEIQEARQLEEILIGGGYFYHLEQDLDNKSAHHFYLYLNDRGVIKTCSDCSQDIHGTWVKIIGLLMIMLKKELRKTKQCIAGIERLRKIIAILK